MVEQAARKKCRGRWYATMTSTFMKQRKHLAGMAIVALAVFGAIVIGQPVIFPLKVEIVTSGSFEGFETGSSKKETYEYIRNLAPQTLKPTAFKMESEFIQSDGDTAWEALNDIARNRLIASDIWSFEDPRMMGQTFFELIFMEGKLSEIRRTKNRWS